MRHRIFFATAVAMLLIVLLGARNYRAVLAEERGHFSARQLALVDAAARGLEAELQARAADLRQVNGLPSVQQLDRAVIGDRFQRFFDGDERRILRHIHRIDPLGRVVTWHPGQTLVLAEAEPWPADTLIAWAGHPDSHDQVRLSRPLPGPDGRDELMLAAAVHQVTPSAERRQPTGSFAGVTVIVLDFHRLVETSLAAGNRGEVGGVALLLDREGRILFDSDGLHTGAVLDADAVEAVAAARQGATLWPPGLGTHRQIEVLAAWSAIEVGDTRWTLLFKTPSSAVAAGIRQTGRHLLLVGLLLVATVLGARALVHRARTEEHYRALFEQAAVAIFIVSPQEEIVEANPAAAALTGAARPDLRRRRFGELFSAGVPPEPVVLANAATSRTAVLEVAVRASGRSVEAELSIGRLSDGNLQVMARDLTCRRQLERQLAQAQNLEAVGRLAGGVAHDFTNVLMIISGCSELLLARAAGTADDEMKHDIREIQTAAARAAALTRQLLAFSRREPVEPKVLDLNGVVSGFEQLLLRLLGGSVALRFELARSPARVLADPGQIEQVIMNLAVNSRDAMAEGGEIIISTADVVLDGPPAEAMGAPPGAYVKLSVRDTGAGMDAQTRERMFDPFFSTKGSGTGLGLATVYGIVQDAGGYLDVTSEVGRGTTIDVYLPAVPDATPDASAASVQPAPIERGGTRPEPSVPAAAAAGAGGETILVVEDEGSVRKLVRKILEGRGYRVREAAQGEQALSEAAAGPIDLLLTDIVMPGLSGPELAQRFLLMRPGTPVLFMSGYTDTSAPGMALARDVPFLSKPFTPAALASKVRAVLDAEGAGR
jgi:PAS domain S-box-containing protein